MSPLAARRAISVREAWKRLGIGLAAGICITVAIAWLDALAGLPVLSFQKVLVRQASGEFASHPTDSLHNAQVAIANLDGRVDGDWSGWIFLGGPPVSVIQDADRRGFGFTRYRLRGWPLRSLFASAHSPWRPEWTQNWPIPAATVADANAQLQPAAFFVPGITMYRYDPAQGQQWDQVLDTISTRLQKGTDQWVMEGGIPNPWHSGDPLAGALPLRIFPFGFLFDCAFWAGVVIVALHFRASRRAPSPAKPSQAQTG